MKGFLMSAILNNLRTGVCVCISVLFWLIAKDSRRWLLMVTTIFLILVSFCLMPSHIFLINLYECPIINDALFYGSYNMYIFTFLYFNIEIYLKWITSYKLAVFFFLAQKIMQHVIIPSILVNEIYYLSTILIL